MSSCCCSSDGYRSHTPVAASLWMQHETTWSKNTTTSGEHATSADDMLGRRKRLDIWSHFTYNDIDKKSECVIITDGKHCGQKISGKNTTNLKRHLKAYHPHIQCLWCIPTKRCITYPSKTILPPQSLCPLNEARWGLCSMNFQILIITLSVAGALLIIGLLVCIFCCCKCENIGSSRFESRMNRQKDKRKTKQEERKEELKIRHDEIRQKYGLSRASPYARFENPK